MTYIDNLLSTVFSANVGESEEDQRAFLRQVSNSPDTRQRDGLRAELEAALADPRYDWEAAFKEHEVYPPQGQSPKEFVIEHIWTPLFGRETVPQAA